MDIQQLQNSNYKRLYSVGQQNIFLIISDKVENKNKDILIKKLLLQLQDIPNYIQTKIPFQIVDTKEINGFVFAIGRYQTTNYSDDETKKIIAQLKSLYFQEKQHPNCKTRNRFTITTQTPFY